MRFGLLVGLAWLRFPLFARLDRPEAFDQVSYLGFCALPCRIRQFMSLHADANRRMNRLFDHGLGLTELVDISMLSCMKMWICVGFTMALAWLISLLFYKA